MTRVNVIVEGQTEEGFVDKVLGKHLRPRNIYVTPILVPAKRGTRTRVRRGGMSSFDAAQRVIRRKLTDDTGAYTTTMLDYYDLPASFPGLQDDACPPAHQRNDRVDYLEAKLAEAVGGTQRIIPYLQVHEFEALLFSDVEVLDRVVGALGASSPNGLVDLHRIANQFETPEAINDDPTTAPSKRIAQIYPAYQKVPFGELVAESIGIERIRAACPRFDAWVTRLENLE